MGIVRSEKRYRLVLQRTHGAEVDNAISHGNFRDENAVHIATLQDKEQLLAMVRWSAWSLGRQMLDDEDQPTLEALRVELSNLRDDLAVIESSEIFALNKLGNQEAVDAIRHRIAEIESVLHRDRK